MYAREYNSLEPEHAIAALKRVFIEQHNCFKLKFIFLYLLFKYPFLNFSQIPTGLGQITAEQYQIIAGERRWRASIITGLEKFPRNYLDRQTRG
jgi:hypothetical protein